MIQLQRKFDKNNLFSPFSKRIFQNSKKVVIPAKAGIQYFKFSFEPLYLTKYSDLIGMTLPEKLNSRLQKYRLTQKGKKPHRKTGEGEEVR